MSESLTLNEIYDYLDENILEDKYFSNTTKFLAQQRNFKNPVLEIATIGI